MKQSLLLIIFTTTTALPFTAVAHQPTKKHKTHCHGKKKLTKNSYWKGSNAQIGYLRNHGNTNNETLNLASNIQFSKHRWTNLFQAQYEYGKTNGVANRNYAHLFNQLQFSLGNQKKRKNYLFANGDAQLSKFGPYSYQTVYAAGYGRDIISTTHFTFSMQAGPGYRRDKYGKGKIDESMVFTTRSIASLRIGSRGVFTQTLQYDIAQSYNYTRSVSAFTNKIIGNVAVQLSYTVTHYSKIPSSSSNSKKTDTQTNISLVYNFVG